MILIGNSAFSNRDVFLPVPAGYTERKDGEIEPTDLILDIPRDAAVRQGGGGCSFRAVREDEVGEDVTHDRIVLCQGEHIPEERQPGEKPPVEEEAPDPEIVEPARDDETLHPEEEASEPSEPS